MRERKDITAYQRMTRDQIKNRITTLLAKKKEEQAKVHNNRQRRYVKFMDDWERDLEEEGGSIEDIEVEVDIDDDRFKEWGVAATDRFKETDLVVTAESMYDWIHSQDDIFEKVSDPVFSDIGEFEL